MHKIFKFLLLFCVVLAIDFGLSKTDIPVNQENYLLGYEHFVKKAQETKGQKRIILVGGSSLSWGVSAKTLTENLGILTLNTGISARISYQNTFHKLEGLIDLQNDIFVISPEYPTLLPQKGLCRSKEFCEIAISVLKHYPLECAGYSLAKVMRITPLLDRKFDDYFKSGFNSYGDYIYRKEGVNMVGGFTQTDECMRWDKDVMMNNYIPFIKSLKAQGYNIVYIPTFLAQSTCSQPEKAQEFHEILNKNFGLHAFKNQQLLFEDAYFYDTPYHLTMEGVMLKTKIFEKHLRAYLR